MSNVVSISKMQKLGQNPSLAVQSRFFRRGQRALDKNPFTLKWFRLFTRKKKCESRKEIHYFSLTMLVNTAVTYLCCTSIKSFTGWQSSNFFKLIQESMQNNYQFSVKTRMIFFDGLCYVYFSSLCVIYCFFFLNQINRHSSINCEYGMYLVNLRPQ